MYNFYGFQNSLKINKETAYRNIKTPKDLYDILKNIWSEYTCAPRLRDKWNNDNKTLGQCSITAFLVQDIFGGEVYATKTKNGIHCFNVVDDIVFDLTSEQFKESLKDLNYDEMIFQDRNAENHFKKEEKYQRYLYLKNKLDELYKCEGKKMKVYIAAPLYCEYELDYNLKIDTYLRSAGFDTYLPQRDGGNLHLMEDYINGVPKDRYVFDKDIEAMNNSDVFLFLLDGRVPDEGAAVALGYFYGSGKPCVGLKTDARTLCDSQDNLMIRMALKKIVHTKEELSEFLMSLND